MRRVLKRNRLLVLAGLGLVALAVSSLLLGRLADGRCGGWSGCDSNGLPLGSVTVHDLDRHTESALSYPGAAVIAHGGTAEQSTVEGRGSAYASNVLATPDSADRVYAWYQAWLSAHGWRTAEMLQSTAELSVHGWKRGSREVMIVSILDPHRWQVAIGTKIASGETIVRTQYGIYPVGG